MGCGLGWAEGCGSGRALSPTCNQGLFPDHSRLGPGARQGGGLGNLATAKTPRVWRSRTVGAPSEREKREYATSL